MLSKHHECFFMKAITFRVLLMTCMIVRYVTWQALHFLQGLNVSWGACAFDEQPHLFSRLILSKMTRRNNQSCWFLKYWSPQLYLTVMYNRKKDIAFIMAFRESFFPMMYEVHYKDTVKSTKAYRASSQFPLGGPKTVTARERNELCCSTIMFWGIYCLSRNIAERHCPLDRNIHPQLQQSFDHF